MLLQETMTRGWKLLSSRIVILTSLFLQIPTLNHSYPLGLMTLNWVSIKHYIFFSKTEHVPPHTLSMHSSSHFYELLKIQLFFFVCVGGDFKTGFFFVCVCDFGYPGTCFVDEAALELRDLPVSDFLCWDHHCLAKDLFVMCISVLLAFISVWGCPISWN